MTSHASAMTPDVADYVASGYFLSRYAGTPDRTGLQLRRISMGHDHSLRRFFPETWALSWCRETRDERLEDAAVFGIPEAELDGVIAWADSAFQALARPGPAGPGAPPGSRAPRSMSNDKA